jgi:hypothetical protein
MKSHYPSRNIFIRKPSGVKKKHLTKEYIYAILPQVSSEKA